MHRGGYIPAQVQVGGGACAQEEAEVSPLIPRQ